ncbi:hypothetical protein AK812_SmicGene12240 [Symbiodinium microadriaticum]|uniref:Uncharacterized protein n=1 Tax=Symbiodinium microadriaticum TaxID=2951 RepID=A0A1Q9EB62_SYMMI|nr:hypothetical protein AK812_SmicGene12240 [Symbiodinium microadriaticum]
MGWWSLGKLSNEMCRTYLLKCKRCFKTLLQNYDAVVEAERAAQLQDHQVAVGHSRSQLRLFPKLTNLLEHFQYAQAEALNPRQCAPEPRTESAHPEISDGFVQTILPPDYDKRTISVPRWPPSMSMGEFSFMAMAISMNIKSTTEEVMKKRASDSQISNVVPKKLRLDLSWLPLQDATCRLNGRAEKMLKVVPLTLWLEVFRDSWEERQAVGVHG